MNTFADITNSKKSRFVIKTPGDHVYFFRDKSADLSFTIADSEAKLYVFGLYKGKDKDKYTLITRQKHTVPGAQSHILIKGIFDDASSFSYEGMIHLHKKATKTDAALESRNLIISENARVTAKPQLEILPADVRCTHAATISHLSKEHINTLQMRGLSEKDAKDLLIKGFAEDLIIQLRERAPKAQISVA